MADRLTASCAALPMISSGAQNARPRARLPAAGTVVTEMNTPDSPPMRPDVSERTPAIAAITATATDQPSGW